MSLSGNNSDYHKIAVLLPCYNEAASINSVVESFRKALPHAVIYVYDNNSSDDTADIARRAGATVRRETRQGKGNVLRRMFADIEADIYVLADGDGTYDASAAPMLIDRLIEDRLDLVNGSRVSTASHAYRPGHKLGNYVLTKLVSVIFGRQFQDMLSGYKVFSRRFVKSFPALSRGFETETELAVHALELRMPCTEVETEYGERPANSTSKLRTYRDGFRILMLIAKLVKDERPLWFFGFLGLLGMGIGVGFGVSVIGEYLATGLVPRLPTAVLSIGLVLTGIISFFTGMMLDMLTQSRQEIKRLAYLSLPPLPAE
ncbi:MAG: glycosyltransferase [Pseudochelatococcus sp.]|jgi:glycosyltransferase involved in cell wall biosynthesis|uniref:glycosyltransferase n=1 Tax=Pseudochelatococcus sp. TaxID=2020869 RepID=UPI003D8AF855